MAPYHTMLGKLIYILATFNQAVAHPVRTTWSWALLLGVRCKASSCKTCFRDGRRCSSRFWFWFACALANKTCQSDAAVDRDNAQGLPC